MKRKLKFFNIFTLLMLLPCVSAKSDESPCDGALGLLLQAESYRMKGFQSLALDKIEQSRNENPDCVESTLLYADILMELGQKQPYFLEKLRSVLEDAAQVFPNRFEFPLRSLELCLFTGVNQEQCNTDPFFQHIRKIFAARNDIPNWAFSDYKEMLAEKFKSEGHSLSAARSYYDAWEFSRNNTFLLAESARMYAQFGMLRKSLYLFQQILEIKEARTGYIDHGNLIRMLYEKLILEGTPEAIKEFIQKAPNDHTILEAAERMMQVGRHRASGSLLNSISQAGRTQPVYLELMAEHLLWTHQYAKAVSFTQQSLEHVLKIRKIRIHDYFESFLTACMLAGKEKHATSWYRNHTRALGNINGFPRILLSLIVHHAHQDRTLWNLTFYKEKLTPSLENFRRQSEETGLELTYHQLHLSRFLYYNDNTMVKMQCENILAHEKLTLNLETECADSLALSDHFEDAYEIYTRLLERTPDNPLILNNYGYFLLLNEKDLPLAETYIQKAITIDPKNEATLDSLAWLHYKNGDLEQAKNILEASIDQASKDAVKLDHLADIYAALGEREKALPLWSQALKLHPKNFFDILNKLDPET